MNRTITALFACNLLAAPLLAGATPKVVLIASSPDNLTERGLTALGVAHERLAPAAFRGYLAFDADLLIWGCDESREKLADRREELAAFLRAGGVLLGFRSSADDWLLVAASRDKSYELGVVLRPEHPLFNRPHRMSREQLRAMHGGSIYHAFRDLDSAWVPLLSTGREQSWDKTPAAGAGPRYGLIELPLGKGRLILCQLIPEYAWLHDAHGDRECPGARLFENLVRYALSQSSSKAAARPARVRPTRFFADLTDVLETPVRRSGIALADSQWRYESAGPYTQTVDRRGVLTFTHADRPSVAGSFAQLSRSVTVPAGAGPIVLRWYETDTYCGGREIHLGGKQHGQVALENYKRKMRYAQVMVNGATVWEDDVCGPNPQPARHAVRYADVTELVRNSGRCEVALRVADRQGSGEQPFAIDVFFAAIELLTDLRLQPAAGLSSAGFAADGQALRLDAARAVLKTRHTGPDGRYALAVRVTDDREGRSALRLVAGGKTAAEWALSADDGAGWWAVAPTTTLRAGDELRVEIEREGLESPRIEQLAVIPERLLTRHCPAATPPARTGEGAKQVRFSVIVPETAGMARSQEIAVSGLPFPAGCLADRTPLRVIDPAGRPVACQFRPVGRWPDGTARTAVVAFPVSVGAGKKAIYTIEAGDNVQPGPAGGLRLVEEPGRIRIDTGPLQAVLSTSAGRVVEELRRGAHSIKPAEWAWDLVVETEDGRLLRSGGATVSATQIVERGPLRALVVRKGTLADRAGKQLDYRLTVEATAGSELLRVEMTLVNREDQPEVYLKRWSFEVPVASAETGRVDLGGELRAANAGATLYQHREDQLTWSGTDGARSRAPGRAPGWVRLPGLAIGTRWFWERFPQAIRFTPGAVRFDLLPEAFDPGDLPTRWRDRMREVTDRYSVGGVGYPQSPGKMGLFRLAQGEALSQEFGILADGAAPAAGLDASKRLTAPLRGAADPAYTAATGAFGPLEPKDVQRFARYEHSVDRCYAGYLAQRAKRREYGFENFGDSTFEWGYGPAYTYWSDSEYDHHHGFAVEYLRSADPRWWDLCEATARHYRDVVVVHHASPKTGMRGGPHHHNATSLWMPQHDEQCWIADHTLAGCDVSHSWVEGIIAYAWLSGDPWAEEVLREMADWYATRVERDRFGAGGQERSQGWALIAISALVQATGDERLRKAGAKVADWLLDRQDPIRGVVSVPISEQPSYEGGSTFMHGIVGRGLGRWYDVTGQVQVKDAAVGIAEWITTEPMGAPGMFWYKQSPQNSKRFGADDQVLTALTYGYKLSGDRWFADIARAVLAKTSANIRSMSWYGQSLGDLTPQP